LEGHPGAAAAALVVDADVAAEVEAAIAADAWDEEEEDDL
jgi:hypothetical protein